MSKKVIGFTIAGLTAAGIASDHLVEDAKQISKLESNVSDFVENILDIIDKRAHFHFSGA